jgi:hypothetical protein
VHVPALLAYVPNLAGHQRIQLNLHSLVNPGEVFAVRGPKEFVPKPIAELGHHFAGAIDHILDHEVVLSVLIAPAGYFAAIG